MEFSKRNKILSMIYPAITVLYGVFTFLSRAYQPMVEQITGAVITVAGIVVGVLIMTLKIDTSECLKMQTIAFVVTVWMYVVTHNDLGTEPYVGVKIYFVLYLIVDIGSIFLMMIKLPDKVTLRQKLAVFFANPVLYMLLNNLMEAFGNLLAGVGLLKWSEGFF